MAHARIEATVSDYCAGIEYWALEALLDLDGGLPDDEQELPEATLACLEARYCDKLPIGRDADWDEIPF